MKRGSVIAILIILISVRLYAQNWPKTYINMKALSNWVIENYDKGYVILGTKVDYKMGWIIKTDINGNVLWNKKLGTGQYNISPENIEQTQDNGFILGGTIDKMGNQNDAFILKLNSCAELEWCKIIYTPTIPTDLGWCVKSLSNGYLLLGYGNDKSSRNKINLFRFDENGQLSWHYYYPPDSLFFDDIGYQIYIDTDGYVITGSGYYPDPGWPPSTGAIRPYYIKTDTNGNTLWKTIYGKGTSYWGSAVSLTKGANNNYYTATRHDDTTGNDYPSLIKLYHNGDTSYSVNLIQNSYLGIATTINVKDDTTLILGIAWSPDNSPGPVGLVKTDTLGNVKQDITFLTSSSTISATAKTHDSKYISVMTKCNPGCYIFACKVNSNLAYDSIYNHPFRYDSLCSHPIDSDTIVPNCDLIVDVQEPIDNPETTNLKIFPNPGKTYVTIELPKYLKLNSGASNFQSTTIYHQWKSTILEAYDLNGRQVFQKEIPKDQPQLEMDVSTWSKGMYFFRLVYNKQTVASAKVILN